MDDILIVPMKIIKSELMGYYSSPNRFRLARNGPATLNKSSGRSPFLILNGPSSDCCVYLKKSDIINLM